ncbi:MAG: metallophosphoesterase [Candidatus Heimdallarchaeota archaeon]|nr:metallophosphoesterase [Candidatus Heimdallarchaeota archaeon]
MSSTIIPPEGKGPSRRDRAKILEYKKKRDAEEENFYALEVQDFDKVEYRPYDTKEEKKEDLPKIDFFVDKIYMQRIVDDPTKILVTAYIDYGFLKSNKVNLLVDVDKKHPFKSKAKGSCMIHLFNAELCEIAEIPMKHSSEFQYHPVTSAPELFLGLIEELQEKKNYYYRIECFDENKKLIGSSRIKQFTAGVHNQKNPTFFVSVSDIHAGNKAKFKRGKVRGCKPRTTEKLDELMLNINLKELDYTFNKGYQAFTTSGDNVDNGSYHEYWADLFTCGSAVLSRIPFVPTLGNHGYFNGGIGRGAWFGGKKRTQKHFHMFVQTPKKEGGAYYSHTEGNVLMIHLDTVGLNWGNERIDCESRQWKWLFNVLKEWRKNRAQGKGPQFCIVYLHSAILTVGMYGLTRNNSDAFAQTTLTPLFDSFGVTAAIYGHDHVYQRSQNNDTTYICIGVSSKGTRNIFDNAIDNAGYDIQCCVEGDQARGYAVTYVPPNLKTMADCEKQEFEQWLGSIKQTILDGDLLKYYKFDEGRESPKYKELMSNDIKKLEFIQNEIIDKMRTDIWFRFYNVKGVLNDQTFLKSITLKEVFETPKCPNEHIR